MKWIGEIQKEGVKLSISVDREIYRGRSRFQRIDVVENRTMGRVLFLDKTFQLTERDEFIYHEMLAHVPLFSIENPENVLIIGGGDGGLARECLKHNIKRLDLVEIDEKVIEISKKYFPTLNVSFNDKRMNVIVDDGYEYIKRVDKKYDAILVDSTDPVGPARVLFNEEFYSLVLKRLNENGIFATQSGSPFFYPEHLKMAYDNLKKIFRYVKVYTAFIPTYPSSFWSFTLASMNEIVRRRERNFETMYYNEDIHDHPYIPNFLKKLVQ